MRINPRGDPPVILTPDQRLRVFVSSSIAELEAERNAVRTAVRELRLLPVMFEAGARPHPPRELYRSYLNQSQIFVGVYGESYGWVPPGETISGLADEFSLAASLPRLIYVKEPAARRDPRLAALLDDIRHDARVSYRRFHNPAELRDQVEQDLAVLLSERFQETTRPGPESEPVAGQLPVFHTPLFGREDDLSSLSSLLTDDQVPLVTLVGPGGIGKTRLAVAAGGALSGRFDDGMRYLDLSATTAPDLVGEALARGLGLRTSGAVPAATDVASWLRTKRLLLVVDNFEQLADGAPVLSRILHSAQGVTALVTSRVPLRLAEERVYEVPALTAPSAGEDIATSPAVRLFVGVARAASPDFELTPENAGSIVEITRRVSGIPLAIVLAAAKVRLLTPSAIVARLGDQLGLLTGGARDMPDRQRTLRDTIDWSYHLLGPDEQVVFDRLGVFRGGANLAAVESVAALDYDMLSVLEPLIESSLVRQDPTADGDVRFSMLDTIRAYAVERLESTGALPAARGAHADFYRSLAHEAEPHLNGVEGPSWLTRLERDFDNIDAAVDWYLSKGEPSPALAILWGTWMFWWRRGHIEESARHLRRVLERSDQLTGGETAKALVALGAVSTVSGQLQRAEKDLARAAPLLRSAGDWASLGLVTGRLGQFAIRRDDLVLARRYLAEAVDLSTKHGEPWQASLNHSRLAWVAMREGRHEEAEQHVLRALEISRGAQEQLGTLVAFYTWAVCTLARQDPAASRHHLIDGMLLAAESNDEAAESTFLTAIADIDSRGGDLASSVRLSAAAQASLTPSNEMWMQGYVPPWPTIGMDQDEARARLGDGYEKAWHEGESMGLDRAIAEAAKS